MDKCCRGRLLPMVHSVNLTKVTPKTFGNLSSNVIVNISDMMYFCLLQLMLKYFIWALGFHSHSWSFRKNLHNIFHALFFSGTCQSYGTESWSMKAGDNEIFTFSENCGIFFDICVMCRPRHQLPGMEIIYQYSKSESPPSSFSSVDGS